MKYVVIVKVNIDKPYTDWLEDFVKHRDVRASIGLHDMFQYPVVGEQSVIYAVRTDDPRKVHDTVYQKEIYDVIRASGFVIGSEKITICDASAEQQTNFSLL